MTMLTPLHQERLQDGRNQSGPRGTAMPPSGKPIENQWKPWKVMGCPVGGGLCGFDNRCIPCSYWWTLSSVCSSTSLSKLLSFHAGWMRFAKAHSDHIVTLLNEKELHNTYWSNWKSTSLNICLKIVWKTFAKKGVLKWALEVSKHLHDHWCFWYRVCKAHGQTTSTHLRVEQCRRMAKDYITMKYHKHHELPLPLVHVRSVASHNDPKLPTVRTTMLTPLHQKHLPR